jgi:hypothetical protein
MKTKPVIAFLILFTFTSVIVLGQKQTYKHPKCEFSFNAEGKWKKNPYHKDEMIYEMVKPGEDIHVMLWYTGGTEMSCSKYLLKMAGMKGFKEAKPEEKEFDRQKVWVMDTSGEEYGEEAHTILAALSYVKAYDADAPERCQGKTFNNLHIARVWCPVEKYEKNKEEMGAIVASLRLKEE